MLSTLNKASKTDFCIIMVRLFVFCSKLVRLMVKRVRLGLFFKGLGVA